MPITILILSSCALEDAKSKAYTAYELRFRDDNFLQKERDPPWQVMRNVPSLYAGRIVADASTVQYEGPGFAPVFGNQTVVVGELGAGHQKSDVWRRSDLPDPKDNDLPKGRFQFLNKEYRVLSVGTEKLMSTVGLRLLVTPLMTSLQDSPEIIAVTFTPHYSKASMWLWSQVRPYQFPNDALNMSLRRGDDSWISMTVWIR